MRKNLEVVSLTGLAVLVSMTAMALLGPNRLPDRVAVHFDAAGQPTAWGSPASLLGLPIAALALYGLMTVVARRPGAFNFPVRVTPANRPRLEALAVEMIAWLKAEVVCLFAVIQYVIVHSARSGQGSLSPAFMPVTLGAVFGTVIVYVVRMRRERQGIGNRE